MHTLEYAQYGVDGVGLTVILIGFVKALWGVIKNEFGQRRGIKFWKQIQHIRYGLGTYLLLGLEFMIVSDIIHSVIRPELDSLIELGALVVLRTLIGYFLGKELAEINDEEARAEG